MSQSKHHNNPYQNLCRIVSTVVFSFARLNYVIINYVIKILRFDAVRQANHILEFAEKWLN